jgi:omega-6 fatty acid desaturase (delta-12 desaturase)
MDISKLKANNIKAFASLTVPFVLLFSGTYLSLISYLWLYLAGQLILSIFFLQTFILLHECGHFSFFKSRFLNVIFGHLFGLLTMIPFYTWQQMHYLHHIWTGWRDKDPTTEKTVEPGNSRIIRIITNLSWRFYIPVFFLSYKLSNYWNLIKIKRFLSAEKYRIALVNVTVYIVIYALLIIFFGHFILVNLLPAFLLSLVWKELVILTQHSHIEIPVSNGNEVRPVSTLKQIEYSRSFYINPILSHYFLFGFNLHEVHHAYPGLPAYWLQNIDLGIEKKPKYREWFSQAKSMKGEDYIFRTSKHTGIKF